MNNNCDIKKELESALRLNQDIIEKAPFGIYIINDKGDIEYVNQAMLNISNDKYEEFIKINVFNFPGYIESGLTEKIKDGLNGKYFSVKELSYTSKIGNKSTIRNFVGIPLVQNGKNKLIMIVEDVTEYKLTEKALLDSEKKFKDLVYSIVDWVWEIDEFGNYIFSSGRVKNILGYEPEEIIGKTPFDFMTKSEATKIKKAFNEKKEKKQPILNFHNWNIRKDGTRVCLATSAVPILDDQGNFKGYRGVDKDITDEVMHLKKIETMNQFMVGRELKMIELKKEIIRLNKELKKKGNT